MKTLRIFLVVLFCATVGFAQQEYTKETWQQKMTWLTQQKAELTQQCADSQFEVKKLQDLYAEMQTEEQIDVELRTFEKQISERNAKLQQIEKMKEETKMNLEKTGK